MARRDNGNGSIRLRSDGRWEAIIQIGTVRKSLYAKTEREVKKKLREYKVRVAQGIESVSKIKLNDYMTNYLTTYKLNSVKASTYDRMESTFVHHVKDTIGYMQMNKITTNDIQDLINKKSIKYSYSSVKKIQELLNLCFKHAYIIGDIAKNPMDGVTMPKRSQMNVKTKIVEEYPNEDIDKIISVINTTFTDKSKLYRYSPMFIFIFNTGLRAGEALALTWDKVDFDKKVVTIDSSLSLVKERDEKSNKTRKIIISDTKTINGNRVIPLNTKAINALQEIKRRNKIQNVTSNFVVSDLNGHNLTPRNFQRTWESITTRAGIKNQGIHALRHSFASRLLRTGVEIKTVSMLLGHSNTMLTYNRYIHVLQEQKIQAIQELEYI